MLSSDHVIQPRLLQEIEASASTRETLDEIEQQFNDLLTPDGVGKGLTVMLTATPMCCLVGEAPSAAQMVLSGLNNLFLPVEHATSQLYKLVDKMTVLEDWNSVDIIGQSDNLKAFIMLHAACVPCLCVYVQGMAPGNLYFKELFFIKRVVAVLDFCHELIALKHAMRADPIES